MEVLNTIKVLDINVTSESEKNILEFIIMRLKKKGLKTKIFTPNSEIAVYATKHPSLKNILNSADVSLPDGYWFARSARVLGKRLPRRITGVDFMQKLCQECAKEAVSIGLLGGKGDVALKAAECLKDRFPGLKIAYISSEWTEEGWLDGTARESTQIGKRMDANKKDPGSIISTRVSYQHLSEKIGADSLSDSRSVGVLFVAFGFPKQEEWIADNIDKLPVQAMMGVGGAFDFLSGKVSRAPKWVQNIGFEWLYRLVRQPWRWRRQLALVEFVGLVLRERLRGDKGN